jgi:drug/metabolite transporter (DMT)-like permease
MAAAEEPSALATTRTPRFAIAPADLGRLALAATCWGLGTVISKAALAEFPPLTLLAVQLAVSLVVLVALMRLRGVPIGGGTSPLLGRLGILNPGIAYALSLLGLVTITASLSVLLWILEPLLILALAAWFLGERITVRFIVFSLAAVAGLALVVYEPSMGTSQVVGVLLTIAGVVCCAVYSVVTRRFIPNAPETSQVIVAQQAHALGFVLLAIVAVGIVSGAILPASSTPTTIAAAIASGTLYYAGAYWFYLGALRRVPASLAATSFYLIPIVGVTASAMLLGERLDARQWVGVVIVLVSVVAAIRVPRPLVRAEQAIDLRVT